MPSSSQPTSGVLLFLLLTRRQVAMADSRFKLLFYYWIINGRFKLISRLLLISNHLVWDNRIRSEHFEGPTFPANHVRYNPSLVKKQNKTLETIHILHFNITKLFTFYQQNMEVVTTLSGFVTLPQILISKELVGLFLLSFDKWNSS